MPNKRGCRVSGPPRLIVSTTPLRNQGLAMARPLDAAIRKQDARNSRRISSSSIRYSNALRISWVVALHKKLSQDQSTMHIIHISAEGENNLTV